MLLLVGPPRFIVIPCAPHLKFSGPPAFAVSNITSDIINTCSTKIIHIFIYARPAFSSSTMTEPQTGIPAYTSTLRCTRGYYDSELKFINEITKLLNVQHEKWIDYEGRLRGKLNVGRIYKSDMWFFILIAHVFSFIHLFFIF